MPPDESGVIDLLAPRSGPVLIAATQVFDPITGLTTENPLQVYVTASDELGVVSVELFYNGASVGRRTLAEDGIQFKNPFIFPKNGASLPLTGTPSGVTEGQLSAVAVDSSGQTIQSETVELLVDGSRPDINVTVIGDGTAGPVTVFAEAADPETGIASFVATPADSLTLESPTTLSGVFTQPGVYDFVFVATNGAAVTNTTTAAFTIIEAPVIPPTEPPIPNTPPTVTLTANPSFGDAPLSVIFTAMAQDEDGDELTYAWDFGNGSTASSGTTQTATYPTAGTYTASVTVSDPSGGTATAQTTVIVGGGTGGGGGGTGNENPTVSLTATPTSGPAPLAVNFTAAATDPDGDALTYTWNFGNGDTGGNSGTEATTYAVDGTYEATVTVTDGNGGTATSNPVTITVGAGGGGGGGTAPTITSFTANPATVSSGGETVLSWDITGTTTQITITPSGGTAVDVTADADQQVAFNPTSTTTYTLTATNGTVSDTETVTVNVTGTGGETAPVVESFTASDTTVSAGETVTLSWTITGTTTEVTISPDGSVVTGSSKQVTPTETTTYTITAKNGTATDTETVTVTVSGGGGGGGGGGNTNPVNAVDDSRGTVRNQDVTISVLANDRPGARALTIVAATSPRQGGRVEISRDSKTITYTPPRGFTGDDFFRYTVRDGDGNGDTAGVTVRVR